eukprot:5217683-Amphidinium_carterae.2
MVGIGTGVARGAVVHWLRLLHLLRILCNGFPCQRWQRCTHAKERMVPSAACATLQERAATQLCQEHMCASSGSNWLRSGFLPNAHMWLSLTGAELDWFTTATVDLITTIFVEPLLKVLSQFNLRLSEGHCLQTIDTKRQQTSQTDSSSDCHSRWRRRQDVEAVSKATAM